MPVWHLGMCWVPLLSAWGALCSLAWSISTLNLAQPYVPVFLPALLVRF